jgi:hypothetical protein
MKSQDVTQFGSNKKLTKSSSLSLLAGVLIIINSALVGVSAKWIPGLLPTLPGSTGNDPALLLSISAVGLTSGILVLIGTLMIHLKPNYTKFWGIWIAVFSIPSVISGGGFIIGLILGVIGGVRASSAKRHIHPKQ